MAKSDTANPPFKMPDWPIDKVERRKAKDLKANPKNVRRHSRDQIAALKRALQEFGWTMPILVDEKDVMLAGHARNEAAISAGIEEVPVIVARGWSQAKRDAYILADNRLAELSDWNVTGLREQLAALDGKFDLSIAGFDRAFLDDVFARKTAGETDPEATPEPKPKPAVRAGDIWVLGNHRIACGSSTDAATVAAVLGKDVPHLMVTDPPYGVEYDPEWRNRVVRANGTKVAARAVGVVMNDDRADWTEAWVLFPGDVAYVWHGGMHAGTVQASLENAGLETRSQIIWAKQHIAIGRSDYHWKHEPCWYAVRKGKKGHWVGGRKQSTVWEIDKPQKSETGHSTQKPVECMKRPIENNSKGGAFIYEPFSGSGTTIIACEMTGRKCLAIELSPAYVQVAIERWEKFTGLLATLNGKTLEQVARARKKGEPKGKTDAKSPNREPVRRQRAVAAEPVAPVAK